MIIGLWLFGTGDALIIEAGIGNTPWTVLAEGIGERTGLSIGALTIIIGACVLALWIPLRERPGLGTVANVIIIGIAIDVMRPAVPSPSAGWLQLLQSVLGTVTIGAGGALYLSAQLGPGPRDGWMTGLHTKFGWPIAVVRLGIELSVLGAGYLLGGTVGLGTVIFAVGIGHTLGLWLTLMRTVTGAALGASAPPVIEEDMS